MAGLAIDPIWLLPTAVFLFLAFLLWGIIARYGERREQIEERLAHLGFEEPGEYQSSARNVASDELLPWYGALDEGDIDRILRSWSLMDRLALDLAQARLRLRVYEYLALRFVIAALAGGVVFLISLSWIVAAIVAVIAYFLPRFYVRRRIRRRIERLNEQLVDTLSFVANALRSGSGLLQTMEDISREMAPPISEEFAQVVHEVNLGADMETAFRHLQTRVRSYDLDLIVMAMLVHRSVGGNLAEILDRIEHTIRERARIYGEIRALTGEVRLSGIVLAALPFVTALALAIMSPKYLTPLFTTFEGQILTAAGTILLLVSLAILRRLANIEV